MGTVLWVVLAIVLLALVLKSRRARVEYRKEFDASND